MIRALGLSAAALLAGATLAMAQGVGSTQEKIAAPTQGGGATADPKANPESKATSTQEQIKEPTTKGAAAPGGNDPNPTNDVAPPTSPADKQQKSQDK